MKDYVNQGSITLEDNEYQALLAVVKYVLENEENHFEESGRQYDHIYKHALFLDFAIRT